MSTSLTVLVGALIGASPAAPVERGYAPVDGLEEMPAAFRQAYLEVAPHPEQLSVYFEKSVQRMRDFRGWTREQIESVRQPMLLIIGDRDIVRIEHAAQMQRLLRTARLAVLPGTDHMAIPDRADWVIGMIDEFLGAR
jgi:pimeloyl-ACP methyl ester carboxylesterase